VLHASGTSNQGHVRPTNEDCFGIDAPLGLCVVADGMGGHNAGEVAARMAVDAVTEYIRKSASNRAGGYGPFGVNPSLSHDGNLLQTAIQLANIEILEAAMSTPGFSGMGTTIVAAFVRGQRLSVAHVGDSRLYLRSGKRLRQLTRDDSWTATVLAHDSRTNGSQLRNHPLGHALTNVVGTHPRTEVHITEATLESGDLLLLTTDGVHGPLDVGRMERVLADGGDASRLAASLVAAALTHGSCDNCTAIVAEYLTDSSTTQSHSV